MTAAIAAFAFLAGVIVGTLRSGWYARRYRKLSDDYAEYQVSVEKFMELVDRGNLEWVTRAKETAKALGVNPYPRAWNSEGWLPSWWPSWMRRRDWW